MKFESVNPYTEEVAASFPFAGEEELEQALAAAHSAFLSWKKLQVPERIPFFQKLSSLLKENHESLARLATAEMGKPFSEAKAEVLKCSTACEFYISHAAAFLAPVSDTIEDGREVTIHYEPMGTVLGVFPWNYPYWQSLRSAIPVMMGGNTMIVKPASNVPQCALALQKLVAEAGFPHGVYQTAFASEEQISRLIADDRIHACTLTGSEKAGSAVAAQAAKYIKKSVLELGGSDPFIVLPDADLDAAIKTAIISRYQNNGQSCIAAKRFIVHADVAAAFREKLIEAVSRLGMGDPMESTTGVGPLARKDLRDKLAAQVDEALAQGAHLAYQGAAVPAKGFFYPPTILEKISPEMRAFREELFGPVASLYVASNEQEIISIANATLYGLGGSIWSRNTAHAKELAAQIETGQVFINSLVRSDSRFPFGGMKRSGFGRELGEQGLKEFCFIKTVWA